MLRRGDTRATHLVDEHDGEVGRVGGHLGPRDGVLTVIDEASGVGRGDNAVGEGRGREGSEEKEVELHDCGVCCVGEKARVVIRSSAVALRKTDSFLRRIERGRRIEREEECDGCL